MAVVRAFMAIRPNQTLADRVAALPYDVMTSEEAREMVKNKPYSFLHIDKAEIDLDPSTHIYDRQVYETARDNLQSMIQNGVLIQDAKPMLYIYRLIMDGRSQTGLVACTSIDEYINGTIKKHELTREDKEQDRIRHVEICDANTGPIFLTYRSKADIDGLINTWTESHTPVYDFVSEDGIGHTAWAVDDEAVMGQLTAAFAQVPALYIADGHHRNASAVKVGLKKRESNPQYTGDEEFNFYLSVIFPHDQLYIMDYNRVVKTLNGNSKKQFLRQVSDKFDLAEKGKTPFKPQRAHTFGMYLDGLWYELSAKSDTYNPADPVGSLDVSILQSNLLQPLLGIEDPRTSKEIDFVGGMRGLSELARRVDSGEMAVAFAMYPTSMLELMHIADAGEIMPPKSTWFEPKLRSGLFIHKLS